MDQENSPDQGWSQANLFGIESPMSSQDDNNINVWPHCNIPEEIVATPTNSTTESQTSSNVYEEPFINSGETCVESQISSNEGTPCMLGQSMESRTINTGVVTESVQQNPPAKQQIMQLNIGSSPTTFAGTHQAYYSPTQKQYVILPKISRTPGQPVYRYQTVQPQQKSHSVIYDLLTASDKTNTNIVKSTPKQVVLSSPHTVYQVRCNQSQQQNTLQPAQNTWTLTPCNNSAASSTVTHMNSSSQCSEEQVPSQIMDHGYAVGSPSKGSIHGNSSVNNMHLTTMQTSNLINPTAKVGEKRLCNVTNRLLETGDHTVFKSYRQETSSRAKQASTCETQTLIPKQNTNQTQSLNVEGNSLVNPQVYVSQQTNTRPVQQIVNIVVEQLQSGQSSGNSCLNSLQTTPLSTNSPSSFSIQSPQANSQTFTVGQISQSSYSDSVLSSQLSSSSDISELTDASSNTQQNPNQNCQSSSLNTSLNSASSLTSSISPAVQDFVLKDNKSLYKNIIYQFKDARGVCTNMKWDGGKLIEVPKESTDGNSGMKGGGVGMRGRDKNLKGNATGLNMVSNSQGVTVVRQNLANSADAMKVVTTAMQEKYVLPNGRLWQHADSPPKASSLARRPLHQSQDSVTEVKSSDNSVDILQSLSNSSQQNSPQTSSTDKEIKNGINRQKRTFNKAGEEMIVVCRFCGYLSSNLESCERCNRTFPSDTKPQPKRQKTDDTAISTSQTSASSSSNSSSCTASTSTDHVITTKGFYGNKLQEQSAPYEKTNILSVKGVASGRGRKIRNRGSSYKMVRMSSNRKNQLEPETVTISSDEEDSEKKPSPTPQTPGQTQESKVSSTVSDDGQTQSTEETDELSKLVSKLPQRPSSPKFKGSRLNKMEDKQGVTVAKPPRGRGRPRKIRPEEETLPPEIAIKKEHLELGAKCVKVGSLRGVPVEPVFITPSGISLYIECEENTHRININPEDVLKCFLHFSQQSMLFLQTTADFGCRMRKLLEMSDEQPAPDSNTPYFDPLHEELQHKYVTIIPLEMDVNKDSRLRSILNKYQEKHDFYSEQYVQNLSFKEAENLLDITSPPSVKKPPEPSAGTSDQPKSLLITTPNNKGCVYKVISGSAMKDGTFAFRLEQTNPPSPPPITFTGPIEKLVCYPPPPSIGRIMVTTADLFCLNEGEFLNDVIIDFFLKYLTLEMINEEDRKRTYVFSSFFFKCLTQRQSRSVCKDGSDVLSPAEKRHARVKKWTKHVDLFEKDFIIVPINEHSHWFLAIICFPGLQEIQPVHYLPRSHMTPSAQEPDTTASENSTVNQTSKDTEMKDESQERKETPMDTSESSSQPSTPIIKLSNRELNGQIITDLDSLEPEQKKFVQRGQRQPCIMIFDSLAGQSKSRIIAILKDYLQVEWKMKKDTPCNIKERIRGCTPKVPQQNNFSDCGVYVLQYAQSFFEVPVIDYTHPIKCLQNWFDESVINRKRQEIRDLVMKLKEKHEQQESS